MTCERLMKLSCYSFEVQSVSSAVQMLILNIDLLPYCVRAKPYIFSCKNKTEERLCFALSFDVADVNI